MADINIQMQQRNEDNTAWNNVYPKTKASIVTSEDGTTMEAFKNNMTVGMSGKINHSLATAANDFLVASGVGIFVKKTLAEVKAILGLGSAAYTNTNAYATATQGATADSALAVANAAVPKAGNITMTGKLVANAANDHTVKRVRNCVYKDGGETWQTTDFTIAELGEGEQGFVYR